MKKLLPLFLKGLLLVLFIGSVSTLYVYLQEKKNTTREIDELYERQTRIMDKQIAESWFKATIRLGAYEAVSQQLFTFSDDYFDEGIIHNKQKNNSRLWLPNR